ncbi:hypothetical protein N752_14355 [Desulforamulus aquiferis]|nr:hypothetical protein N752_14355 [Desulforamulus aquiferis]
MRIIKHPILDFKPGNKIRFTYDGKEIEGFEGETIAPHFMLPGLE